MNYHERPCECGGTMTELKKDEMPLPERNWSMYHIYKCAKCGKRYDEDTSG